MYILVTGQSCPLVIGCDNLTSQQTICMEFCERISFYKNALLLLQYNRDNSPFMRPTKLSSVEYGGRTLASNFIQLKSNNLHKVSLV